MISREFVLAGRAIFTVSNDKGEHYTYRVTAGSFRGIASVLTGSDNLNSYTVIGVYDTKTGELTGYRDDRATRVLQWALRRVWLQDSLPQGYDIRHAGKCGRCGRLLTTPESIESGFGPTCIGKV